MKQNMIPDELKEQIMQCIEKRNYGTNYMDMLFLPVNSKNERISENCFVFHYDKNEQFLYHTSGKIYDISLEFANELQGLAKKINDKELERDAIEKEFNKNGIPMNMEHINQLVINNINCCVYKYKGFYVVHYGAFKCKVAGNLEEAIGLVKEILDEKLNYKDKQLLATIIIKGEKYKIYKTSDDDYFVEVNEETLIDDDLDNLIEVLSKKVESLKKETADAEFNETLELLNKSSICTEFNGLKSYTKYAYKVADIAFSNHNETVYFYKDYYIMGSYKPAMSKDFKECVKLYKNRGGK